MISSVTHGDVHGPQKWKIMAQPDSAENCRLLGQVIDRIADKWAVMVVGHLSSGETVRFNALMGAIPGISHRMLTLTLRALEREGLVLRTTFATIPPRVDYALTPLGQSLTSPLSALAGWASDNRVNLETARASYDAKITAKGPNLPHPRPSHL